jgi:CBS domain-containing protein
MTPDPDVVADWMSVQDLLDDYVLRLKHSTFPVRDRSGHLSGLVTLDRIKAVPPSARTETAVAAIAVPISEVPVARAGRAVRRPAGASRREQWTPGPRAPLGRTGEPRLVGIITPTDIARAIEVQSLASHA